MRNQPACLRPKQVGLVYKFKIVSYQTCFYLSLALSTHGIVSGHSLARSPSYSLVGTRALFERLDFNDVMKRSVGDGTQVNS